MSLKSRQATFSEKVKPFSAQASIISDIGEFDDDNDNYKLYYQAPHNIRLHSTITCHHQNGRSECAEAVHLRAAEEVHACPRRRWTGKVGGSRVDCYFGPTLPVSVPHKILKSSQLLSCHLNHKPQPHTITTPGVSRGSSKGYFPEVWQCKARAAFAVPELNMAVVKI